MAKSITITVHPAAAEADLLTVADAMRQVLDMVEALERLGDKDEGSRKIVWRLLEAHTNSPPFTVVAQATALDPTVSIALEAERVTNLYSTGISDLLDGRTPSWMTDDIAIPLKRAFKRNLNGVGLTELKVDDRTPVSVAPASARTAMIVLEREIEDATIFDLARTEYGSIEGEVISLTKWHERRAIVVIERLSEQKVTCVLTDEVADKIAPLHTWDEAWNGSRVQVSGALHYDPAGSLRRVDALSVEPLAWTDVPLSDLRDIDILQGRSVTEHLRRVWGEDAG